MKYGTVIGGVEWEIDLDRKRMVCSNDPKMVRRLTDSEVKLLRKKVKKNG